MTNQRLVKETLIGIISASIAIPALWLMAASLDGRDVRSPGPNLVVLTLVGAILVMVLRSTWRETANCDGDGKAAGHGSRPSRESFGGGQC